MGMKLNDFKKIRPNIGMTLIKFDIYLKGGKYNAVS